MLGSAKARVFAGPRYVEWRMNDSDGQVGPFTFRVNTRAIGPRIGAAFSGPLSGGLGWMFEGSASVLRADVKGTPGGAGAPIPLKVSRTITNAELRTGLEYAVWNMSKITVGYQAVFWNGALPEFEYNGLGAALVGGRANTTNHGPFARFTYNQ